MDHGQVERTEVFVEGEVGQVAVDVEEEGVLEVLGRFLVSNPVKFI